MLYYAKFTYFINFKKFGHNGLNLHTAVQHVEEGLLLKKGHAREMAVLTQMYKQFPCPATNLHVSSNNFASSENRCMIIF